MSKTVWKIVGVTVLMILTGSGVFIACIIGSIEGFSLPIIGGALVAGVLTYFSIILLIKLNGQYKDELSEKMRTEGEFITEWTCSESEWKIFIDEQLASGLESAASVSKWIGGIFGVLAGVYFYMDMSGITAFAYGVASGVVLGGFIFLIMRKGQTIKFDRFAKTTEGKIAFGKKAVQLNHQLIDWSTMFATLRSVKLNEEFTHPILQFTVRTNAGKNSNVQTHSIPVPSDKLEEAKKMTEYYNGTI